ncbi:MAG: Wzz/FepE/Etk N-terminal domain-containing protein, partial [Microthrixaceae bacterium]
MSPVESPPQDDEPDLRAYLSVLRRRWKLVALAVVITVAAALGLSLRQDPQYRAESEMLIRQTNSSSIISNTPVIAAGDAARQLNNEVKLFKSAAVEEAVVAAYDGPLDPAAVDASVAAATSDVLQAHLTANDPDEAAKLVNLYVSTFIETRRQQRVDELLSVGSEIQAKIDDLDARIAKLRKPLTDLEARLAADAKNAALQAQRDDLASELAPSLTPLEDQRSFYESQIEDLKLTADIAQSGGAQVVTPAEAPEAPVSPNPLRDAVLALVLGLMLGVGLAFLVDTLDERIRSVGDLELLS